MSDPTVRAEARVATANACKYMQQLCKHFQHKLPAEFDAAVGSISFPAGEVRLTANAETLAITLEAKSDQELDRLEDVVARHLARFAFREELDVQWRGA